MSESRLIAKRGKEKLYFVEEIEFGTFKKRMGKFVNASGKSTVVDIDDVLSRSNWVVVDEKWLS